MSLLSIFSHLLLYLAVLLPVGYVIYQFAASHVTRAVFFRNLASYFLSVLGYLFIVAFVTVAAILAFNDQFFADNLASMHQLTAWFPWLLLFLVPAITMTAWAEERKQGTDELLFTLPAADREILIGKYLAVLAVYTVVLGFSVMIGVMLSWIGDPNLGPFVTTYLGYWLAGAALLAAGMFASALSRNATVAFVLGVLICAAPVFLPFVYWLFLGAWSAIPTFVGLFSDTAAHYVSGHYLFVPVRFVEERLTVGAHLNDFSRGVIPLTSVLYFISLAAVMLYANYAVIRRRHWAGGAGVGMGVQYAARAAALVVTLVAVNVIAAQAPVSADLTPQKYYTLSEGTRNIIAGIEPERPVTVQAFVSPDVPREYLPAKQQLLGLLRRIEAEAGGKVDVQVVELEPFDEEVEQAERFGITPETVQRTEAGRFSTDNVYMGLVFESSYDTVVLPFVGHGATPLEYEIARSLATVSDAHRLTLGILETDARMTGGTGPAAHGEWPIVTELKKQYDVESVDPAEPIAREKLLLTLKDTSEYAKTLDGKKFSDELRRQFDKEDERLSDELTVTVVEEGERWTVVDEQSRREYRIRREPKESEEETEDEAATETPDDGPAVAADAAAAADTEKAEDVLNVYVDRYDVLLAVMPSTLSSEGMRNLVEWVESGGPTLIFDDPLPYRSVQRRPVLDSRGLAERAVVQLAPSLPPSPQSGAGPRGEIRLLTDALGISWEEGELVWDLHNPLKELQDLPIEYVFADDRHMDEALSDESPITKGLETVFFGYPGRVREVEGRDDVKVTVLATSTGHSGVLEWDEYTTTTTSPLSMGPIQVLRNPHLPALARGLDPVPYTADNNRHPLAVRIRGTAKGKDKGADKQADPINAVFVADVDVIADWLLDNSNLKRENADIHLDNIAFVLNAVDELAGVEELIPLRRRKPSQPTLTRIEHEVGRFREAQAKAEEQAREEMTEAVEAIEERFEERRKAIEQNSQLSEIEKADELARMEETAQRQLEVFGAKAEQDMHRKQRRITAYYQRRIHDTEKRFQAWAVVFSALPPIFVGMIFLGWRLVSERNEIPIKRHV